MDLVTKTYTLGLYLIVSREKMICMAPVLYICVKSFVLVALPNYLFLSCM